MDQLEATSKKQSKTVSSIIAEALQAYFTQDGKPTPPPNSASSNQGSGTMSAPSQSSPTPAPPSTSSSPQLEVLAVKLQALLPLVQTMVDSVKVR